MKKLILALALALGLAAAAALPLPLQHCGCSADVGNCSVPCSSCCAPDPCWCTKPDPTLAEEHLHW